MGARRDMHWGIGAVLSERLSPETETAQGAGTFDSSYTEAGPIPGHPEPVDPASRWRPAAYGAQSRSIEVRTLRGGWPGREGAAVAYRLEGDSSNSDWRGWDDPNTITDWTAPADAFVAAADWDQVACATELATGKILVVARSATAAKCWSYDPRTAAWTDGFIFGTNPGLDSPIALVYDEDASRFILWSGAGAAGSRRQIAYYSDDLGQTWSLYTRGCWGATIAAGSTLRVATKLGADWLAIVSDPAGGATGLQQFASGDRGVSWTKIGASFGTGEDFAGYRLGIVAEDYGYSVYYAINDGTLQLGRRKVGSARSYLPDAAQEELGGAAGYDQLMATRDDDGITYVHTMGRTIGYGDVYVHRFITPASTGDGYLGMQFSTGDGTVGTPIGGSSYQQSCKSHGSIWIAALGEGAADVAGTWHLQRWGGWTNVECGPGGDQLQSDRSNRCQIGGDQMDYLPHAFPESMYWTRVGAAGSRNLAGATNIGLEISATQLQQEQYSGLSANAASAFMCGQAIIKVSAATPNRGASGVTYDSGLVISVRVGDVTNQATASIEIGADGYHLWDGTTSRTSVAVDMTQWLHLRWFVRLGSGAGGATIWHKRDGDTKWTRAVSDDTITQVAYVLNPGMIWGHALAAIAGTSRLFVRLLSCARGSLLHGIDAIADLDDSLNLRVRGLWYGRAVPGRDAAYPLPELTVAGEDIGYLSAVGGPTYSSEIVDLPVAHQYGAELTYPLVARSPGKAWRSLATAEVKIAWDQGSGNESYWGAAIALVVLRAVPRLVEFAVDNGAGGWTTLGTLDKGWSSINYTLAGRHVIPRSGTATIGRYFGEDELKGGYMVCSTAGSPVARRIGKQTAGFWTTDNSVQRIRIELVGVDGTESTSGSGEIVHHSGVCVIYPSAETARRYARIRIASGATTPEGYYEAGVLAVCRLAAVGVDPGWDWQDRLELSRTTERAPNQALQITELGPPRRVLEYGWTDGVVHQFVRSLAESPDYLAPVATGFAVGSEEDADYQIRSLLEHDAASGEVPVLVIPRLPAATGTITDPTQYLYGQILSDSIGISGFGGTEGVDELVRLDSLAVEEIR